MRDKTDHTLREQVALVREAVKAFGTVGAYGRERLVESFCDALQTPRSHRALKKILWEIMFLPEQYEDKMQTAAEVGRAHLGRAEPPVQKQPATNIVLLSERRAARTTKAAPVPTLQTR